MRLNDVQGRDQQVVRTASTYGNEEGRVLTTCGAIPQAPVGVLRGGAEAADLRHIVVEDTRIRVSMQHRIYVKLGPCELFNHNRRSRRCVVRRAAESGRSENLCRPRLLDARNSAV